MGLVSAYHHHFKEPHGEEKLGTYFEYYRAERTHHLDYIFAPGEWAEHGRARAYYVYRSRKRDREPERARVNSARVFRLGVIAAI